MSGLSLQACMWKWPPATVFICPDQFAFQKQSGCNFSSRLLILLLGLSFLQASDHFAHCLFPSGLFLYQKYIQTHTSTRTCTPGHPRWGEEYVTCLDSSPGVLVMIPCFAHCQFSFLVHISIHIIQGLSLEPYVFLCDVLPHVPCLEEKGSCKHMGNKFIHRMSQNSNLKHAAEQKAKKPPWGNQFSQVISWVSMKSGSGNHQHDCSPTFLQSGVCKKGHKDHLLVTLSFWMLVSKWFLVWSLNFFPPNSTGKKNTAPQGNISPYYNIGWLMPKS